jgi:bifunctional lysine-specific demethylase and histidyl-hydroxylase NO66
VMAQMVDTLRDDASDLSTGAAKRLIRRHADRTRPVAVRPLASLRAAERADTTSVRWRHGLVASLEHSGDRVQLRLPDKVISFPESCAEAVAALHLGLAADAAGLPGLDHADATVLIRRLLREAVVVPVTE